MTETPIERKAHDHRVIQELLDERRQLWSLFSALVHQRPAAASDALDVRVREFCQVLVDYISLGHFEIYPRLTEVPERRDRVQTLANTLYPRFAEATDAAIAFNDKYEALSGNALRTQLDPDLQRLGEALNIRFALEDQLIDAMSE
jgi:regulator of sigma D